SGGGGHKKGSGVKKAKKLSTRVDLTPMVDLGFLLITFFIFTTTLSQPTGLKLNLPKDVDKPEDQTKSKESGTITFLLGKDNHVFYYEGQLKVDASGNNFKSSSFNGENSVRDLIIKKKREVIAAHVHDSNCEKIRADFANKNPKASQQDIANSCLDRDLVVVIKPNEESTYKNVVDILDEMAINVVSRYALVDITDDENKLIKITEGQPK
ncbi:MAG: biopolymer transporter ExbD, partial [Chitinophagaceae bacterium]|nr:biopolymer transporter ExbD [Chitinophagaceae bacterium]